MTPANGPFAIISAKAPHLRVGAIKSDGVMRPLITGYGNEILTLTVVEPGKYHIILEEGSQKWHSKQEPGAVVLVRETESDVWSIESHGEDKYTIQAIGGLFEGEAWTLRSGEPSSPLTLRPLQAPPTEEQLWRIVDLRNVPSFPPGAE